MSGVDGCGCGFVRYDIVVLLLLLLRRAISARCAIKKKALKKNDAEILERIYGVDGDDNFDTC